MCVEDATKPQEITKKYAAIKASRGNCSSRGGHGGDDDYCTDSGATDIMILDYHAFISYHTCFYRFFVLDDNTKLPILGEGTAVFSLNGKTIMMQDASNVPGLRAPLYSLQKHKYMPGYGTFSLMMLAPTFYFPTSLSASTTVWTTSSVTDQSDDRKQFD